MGGLVGCKSCAAAPFRYRAESVKAFLVVPPTNYFFGVPGQDEELKVTFNHDGRTDELGTGYGHIALAVDDLDATLEQLKGQGIKPEREPYPRPRGRLASLLRARPRRVASRVHLVPARPSLS
jgi:catechol 2,3-dioxygenase-like lactoylglutathione lyase family enzyme